MLTDPASAAELTYTTPGLLLVLAIVLLTWLETR